MANRSLPDLTGRTFGRLTVVAAAPTSPTGNRRWRCHCACGHPELVTATTGGLNNGSNKSCGCLTLAHRRRRQAAMRAKHRAPYARSEALGVTAEFDEPPSY